MMDLDKIKILHDVTCCMKKKTKEQKSDASKRYLVKIADGRIIGFGLFWRIVDTSSKHFCLGCLFSFVLLIYSLFFLYHERCLRE